MTLRVRLLGQPRIQDPAGPPARPPRGQKSWALLARVALADRPLARGELAAELFGEADDPLGALRWCLADLRRSCQNAELLRGDPVNLADGALWLDVRALWDGSLPAAEIGGALLEGVEPRNCPAFDVWLMLARGRCAARSMEELRRAALGLLTAGDPEAAIQPAGRAVALDPLDEGAQELFLRTLVAAGHPARAAFPARSSDLATTPARSPVGEAVAVASAADRNAGEHTMPSRPKSASHDASCTAATAPGHQPTTNHQPHGRDRRAAVAGPDSSGARQPGTIAAPPAGHPPHRTALPQARPWSAAAQPGQPGPAAPRTSGPAAAGTAARSRPRCADARAAVPAGSPAPGLSRPRPQPAEPAERAHRPS